jgi:hypothetical protein
LCILASEDVGLADPQAMVQAAVAQIVHLIGMPEGLFPLTQAAIYLAGAPKSNAVKRAYFAAAADRQVLRLLEQLVSKCRSIQQQIKAFLLQHGIAEPDGALRRLELLPELRFCLDVMHDERWASATLVESLRRKRGSTNPAHSFFSNSFHRRQASSRPFLSPVRASGASPPRMNPWPAPS